MPIPASHAFRAHRPAVRIGLAIALVTFLGAHAAAAQGFSDNEVLAFSCQPHSFDGVPLLTGFSVDFNSGDKHVLAVGVSPLFEIVNHPLAGDTRGQACARYQNNFAPPTFDWDARYHDETRDGVVVEHVEGRCADGGTCSFPVTPPSAGHTFVLIGFEFAFDQRQGSFLGFFRPGLKDHHIGTIAIHHEPDTGNLRLQFADKNNDDAYVFDVWYAWVPDALIAETGSREGREEGADEAGLPSRAPTALRGFTLTYGELDDREDSDHHSDEIGIFTDRVVGNTNLLEVLFNDKNDDDTFEWRVEFAVLEEVDDGPIIVD